MQIASEMGGFTMGEADTLRRAMGKKDRDLMVTQREKFRAGCAERTISKAKADRVWELMEKFAGYGFNKCVSADAQIEMADGTRKPITEVQTGDLVITKDGAFKALGVRPSGLRRVGRLELANGMFVRCTPDHPTFTQRGWVDAEDLTHDDFVAVTRELPCGSEAVPEHLPALLGYALSEGSLGYDSHFYLYSTVADETEDMRRVVAAFPNTLPRIEYRPKNKASSVRPVRLDRACPSEAVTFLFDSCGLQGKTATVKRVPSLVDRWDRGAVAVLVAKLFQGDGCIHPKSRSIYYATSSEGLAQDVRRLLLKLSISSTIHRKTFAYRGGKRTGFTVNLLGGRSAYARVRELVEPHLVGHKRDALDRLVAPSAGMRTLPAPGTVDVIPAALYRDPLREAILKLYPTLKEGCRRLGNAYGLRFNDQRKRGIRRDTLAWLAERLDTPALHTLVEQPMGWSRPKRFVLEGDEQTYDFEVPGARSFVANGIAVHNSHAAAYALVAYQTAYFKANYPVEFMAALLTSEMGDTDRIVKHIEECRAMGIRVEPPDVNVSAVRFSVVGDTVRFGLAAIKNVGEAAMESILRTRAEAGPLPSPEDFFARVDLPLLNRRVVESRGPTTTAELATKGHGARVLLFGHATGLKETSTKSGNRMAFFSLEDMDGTVDVTVFPEPYKAGAAGLHSREALLVRGRVDDGEKGRVVLADDIRPLEQALAETTGRHSVGAAEANACRIRVAAAPAPDDALAALRPGCAAHPGRVSLFLHLLLASQEVVVRCHGVDVDASQELCAKIESLLGAGTITVEYAGRA